MVLLGLQVEDKGNCKNDAGSAADHYQRVLLTGGADDRWRLAFDCKVVHNYCEANSIELRIISAYSPHIAGLIKNGNTNLLAMLHKLCVPGLGEGDYAAMVETCMPANWPAHFEMAIMILNNRQMPSLQCSPAELMFGLIVNTEPMLTDVSSGLTTEQDIAIHQAYLQQQQLDGYAHTIEHADRRKAAFDKHVMAKAPWTVMFLPGQLC